MISLRMLRRAALALSMPIVLLRAQNAPGHQGIHVALGGGVGALTPLCDCESLRRESGSTFMLRIGGAVRSNAVVSGEVNGWVKSQSGARMTSNWLNLVVQLYPRAAGGFYMKGGVGVAQVRIKFGGNPPPILKSVDPGAIVGVGYDVPMTKSVSISPYVDYLYAHASEATYNGTSFHKQMGATLVQYGVALSWR